EPVNGNVGMIFIRPHRRFVRRQTVSVYAMDDIYTMSSLGERVRESVHKDPIATEVVGRVEGRDHAEPKRAHTAASLSASKAARPPLRHVSSCARSRARSPSVRRNDSPSASCRMAATSAASSEGWTKIPPPLRRSGKGLAVVAMIG